MLNDDQLSALLRLKRHEQPPPDYFDSFLREFQRRQRQEMLRQPLWRIALDRISAFVSEHSMPRYGYATAMGVVLVIGAIVSLQILQPDPQQAGGVTPIRVAKSEAPVESRSLALDQRTLPAFFLDQPLAAQASTYKASADRRYIIDRRPFSYEPPASY